MYSVVTSSRELARQPHAHRSSLQDVSNAASLQYSGMNMSSVTCRTRPPGALGPQGIVVL